LRGEYRLFYEELGRKYPEESIVYGSLRGTLRRRFVIEKLNAMKGFLLDAGCNVGTYCVEYHRGKVIGVDIAHSVLKKAKERVPHGLFLVGDLENLNFIKDKRIDNILCTEVLEHLLSPESAVREFYRILADTGRLLLTTPNYKRRPTKCVKLGLLKSYGIQGPGDEEYLHTAFKPSELVGMVKAAGFEVEEFGTLEKPVKYCAKFPLVVFLIVKLVNRLMIRSERLDLVNEKLFNRLSMVVYRTLAFLGLIRFLDRFVKEGVRSYVVARKVKSRPF